MGEAGEELYEGACLEALGPGGRGRGGRGWSVGGGKGGGGWARG